MDTTDEWIPSRTGIQERHIAGEGVFTSDLSAEAAKRALEMAGITADQLDLISVATVTPDTTFPSTACVLQRKIGAVNAACYDLVAACTGLCAQTCEAIMLPYFGGNEQRHDQQSEPLPALRERRLRKGDQAF